jgi:adenylate cyclase
MQRALVELNAEQRRLGQPELAMGIGLNTGEVIVGNIGSEKRTKYGAVGAAINLAYRIEAQTVGGQVLVGPRTYELVRDLVEIRGTLALSLKGVDQPITVYDLAAIRGRYAVALPDILTDARMPLVPPVAATCYRLDGKRVTDAGLDARITAVSATSAEVSVGASLDDRETVKLIIEGLDVYTKVVEQRSGGTVVMAFTDVSPACKQWLASKLEAS